MKGKNTVSSKIFQHLLNKRIWRTLINYHRGTVKSNCPIPHVHHNLVEINHIYNKEHTIFYRKWHTKVMRMYFFFFFCSSGHSVHYILFQDCCHYTCFTIGGVRGWIRSRLIYVATSLAKCHLCYNFFTYFCDKCHTCTKLFCMSTSESRTILLEASKLQVGCHSGTLLMMHILYNAYLYMFCTSIYCFPMFSII
jgi:hypothetical protein